MSSAPKFDFYWSIENPDSIIVFHNKEYFKLDLDSANGIKSVKIGNPSNAKKINLTEVIFKMILEEAKRINEVDIQMSTEAKSPGKTYPQFVTLAGRYDRQGEIQKKSPETTLAAAFKELEPEHEVKIVDGTESVDMNKTLGELWGKTLNVIKINRVKPKFFSQERTTYAGSSYFFPALFYPDNEGNGYMIRCNYGENKAIYIQKMSQAYANKSNKSDVITRNISSDPGYQEYLKALQSSLGNNADLKKAIVDLERRMKNGDFNLALSELQALNLSVYDGEYDMTNGIDLDSSSELYRIISSWKFPFGYSI